MANYHVIKKGDDWTVKKVGSERVSGNFSLKAEAEKSAKRLASTTGGGEVRIHDRNGKIRNNDTVPPSKSPSSRR